MILELLALATISGLMLLSGIVVGYLKGERNRTRLPVIVDYDRIEKKPLVWIDGKSRYVHYGIRSTYIKMDDRDVSSSGDYRNRAEQIAQVVAKRIQLRRDREER